ncbi:sporulation YhaL family protein [Pueribacillus theae]|nr:sporulation YhaL family protein [Pueribacillus theae]
MRAVWLFFGIVVIYFLLHLMGWAGGVVTFFAELPTWGFFVIAGIAFSGYKVVQGVLEDKRTDREFIEQEGQVYIRRIEEERKRRGLL